MNTNSLHSIGGFVHPRGTPVAIAWRNKLTRNPALVDVSKGTYTAVELTNGRR